MPELLYESATTRAFRERRSGDGIVFKESLGAGAIRRSRHEAAMLKRLAGASGVAQLAAGSHPEHVVALRDIDGAPLSQALMSGPLAPDRLLALAVGLADCVASVHRADVIHRDINPANIVLSPAGEPMLIDFDLAIPADIPDPDAREGRAVGTLAYLAPEATGRTGRGVDTRADLYSLGATLYHMATGEPPFPGDDPLTVIHGHLVDEPVPPIERNPRVPPLLSAIILKLLAKAPDARYQSAEGLAHDLRRLAQGRGHGGAFELGERDFGIRLAAPAQLVGREAETAALQSAFATALDSSCRLLLVEGATGVGKSAFVGQLKPMASAAGGWFAAGKFEQFRDDGTEAQALTHALRMLGGLLLALPPEALAAQRQRILDALGRNAGVIARQVPEFALLLGPCPDVPDVDPRQSELRMQQAICDLLAVVVSPERPLVLVLDDLQWASASSLRIVGRLVAQPALRGLLLVGVCRTDAPSANALSAVLPQWLAAPGAAQRIVLDNLSPPGAASLVGSMLRLDAAPAARLADAVGALSGSNPFDTIELLNALRRDRLLRIGEDGWTWDESAIRRFIGRGNVVDLLAARIARLPADSQDLLASLACLGSKVECRLLAAAVGLDPRDLQGRLHPALDDGLLVAEPAGEHDAWRFRHDRVQQAVMDKLGEAGRIPLQLAMARRLAALPECAVPAAQQYLPCVAMLQEEPERRAVARLFLAVADQLAQSARYESAEPYLAAATALLAGLEGDGDDDMRRQATVARHAALYCLARLDEADTLFAALEASAADPLAQVEPTCHQMRSLDMRGRSDEAVRLAVALLARLGAQPVLEPGTELGAHLEGFAQWVARDRRADPASRPQARDPLVLAAAKLLGRTVRSALTGYHVPTIVALLVEEKRLWTEHGPSAELVASMGRAASVLVSGRGDHRTGYEVARHVLAVGEALGFEPQVAEARFILNTYAAHWFEPLEDVVAALGRAYEGVKNGGDASYACFVQLVKVTTMLDLGPTIARSAAEVDAGLAMARSTGNHYAMALMTSQRQVLRAMRGETLSPSSLDDPEFSLEDLRRRWGAMAVVDMTWCEACAMVGLVMNDPAVFVPHALRGATLGDSLAGYYFTVFTEWFRGMARARQMQDGMDGAERDAAAADLERCRAWLAARAADQPRNFLHLARLVEAEQAWALGEPWRAARAFELALDAADATRRPWHHALIAERAGRFHLAQGLPRAARALLAQACELYRAWGAVAKVAQLRDEFALPAGEFAAEPATRSSARVAADTLDLMGVLRASQALSSETGVDRLVRRVTEVLEALSGATRVQVLSFDDGQWWLLATAAGEPAATVQDAAARGLLPMSVFQYAERTGEALVVDDALADGRFARDPYFSGVPVCSLLAAPIAGQGATRAMLLLESRVGRAAFNAQRLDAVMHIAGQLAVSLANAQLYESLESRVRSRTRELEQMQAQLVATARRAGMAETANNVLHNVGNVLNSINVCAGSLRSTIGNSRLDGLARAVGLMTDHAGDLPGFIAGDPRGRALLGYLQGLVGALGAEREAALEDLDRLARSVEHVTYVVDTQQSNAGPSSVREFAAPRELVDEALRLSEPAIARCGMRVDCRHGEMPPMALDTQRVLQVLVNLIGNAAQAMERVPGESRVLTLGTSRIQDELGDRVVFTVRDQGEGIPRENLQRVFAHGFTTRMGGHGFGLHSSALAALEMGGQLTADSDGPGRGAVFTLELPAGRQPGA